MKEFKNFKIAESDNYEGERIHIELILNKKVIVNRYKIKESIFEKKKGDGNCLHMQLTVDNVKRVLFSGSVNLMRDIKQLTNEDLPFTTTIIKNDKRLQFT